MLDNNFLLLSFFPFLCYTYKGDIMEKPNKTKREIVKMLLNREIDAQDEEALLDLLVDQPISIDVDHLADKISAIAGSWFFIALFISFLIIWIVLNTVLLNKNQRLDEYPFILLNLLLSCISALQAPIIMMSQNRQSEKDSLRNQNDYRIDLKSELILEELHDKIETINKQQKDIIRRLDRIEKSGSEQNNE